MRIPRSKVVMMALGGSVGLAAAAGTVHAGLKQESNVSISAGVTTASGGVGTARNSADSVQYIECTLQGFTDFNAVHCRARNTAGVTFSCSANFSVPLATAVASIGVNSRLFVVQSGGVCTQIDVSNGSLYKPAVP